MDDLRFRSQQSPRTNDSPMNSFVSPPRHTSRLPAPQIASQVAAHDHRSNLPRRFTTDSGRVPTLSSLGALTSPTRAPDMNQDYHVGDTSPTAFVALL